MLVLTETHDAFDPGYKFSAKSKEGRDEGDNLVGERWVTICSKHRLERISTSDEHRTTAARVFPKGQAAFLVFGAVLPWLADPWHGFPKGRAAFVEAVNLQKLDWKALRRAYPDDELFVLGDFNQDLVAKPPRYYGSKVARASLEGALTENGLEALTAGDRDPIRRESPPYACIDHICGLIKSRWRLTTTERWPDAPKPLKGKLTDHFGVSVTLELE